MSGVGASNSPQLISISLSLGDRDILCVPSQYATIQAAVNAALYGDVVVVEPGIHIGAGNRNLDFGGKAITVRSVDPNDPCVVAATIIDCENSGRAFYFHTGEDASSVVAGLTITHGLAETGGAIHCLDAGPTILNCVITGNRTREGADVMIFGEDGGDGGGIWCSGSTMRLINCVISHNTTGGGGVGLPEDCSQCGFCGVSGNGGNGGGIYVVTSSVELTNCRISQNETGAGGNASWCISPEHGEPGDGGDGGGLFCESSSVTISSCTVSGNETGDGGWHPSGPDGTEGQGGGIDCQSDTDMINTIVWGNTPDQINGAPAVNYCDVQGGWGGVGNIDSDPCFVSGPGGDYYLSQLASEPVVDNPCVDAGSDTAVNLGLDTLTTRTDQRIDRGIVDMGYHYPIVVIEFNPADVDRDGDVDWGDFALFAYDWWFGDVHTIAVGDVNVDGDISDWPVNVEWMRLDKIYSGSPNDISVAEYALVWDANTDKVYAAVVVYDGDHVFTDDYNNWDASDRIEVYSQGDAAGGTGWNGVYDVAQHYMVGPNTAGGFWGTWALGEAIAGDVGFEYSVGVFGDDIIYEIGVPMFDNYGGISGGDTIITELEVGDVVGFDILASSRWFDGFGMLSENLMAGKYNDADQFARYLLVEYVGCADLDGDGLNTFNDVRILCDNWLAGK